MAKKATRRPYCVVDDKFRAMTVLSNGRFTCENCGHIVFSRRSGFSVPVPKVSGNQLPSQSSPDTEALGPSPTTYHSDSSLRRRRKTTWQRRSRAHEKKSGRKYGQAASKTVESAMRRRKKGTLKSGRGGKGGHGEEPRAGHRDWPIRSSQERRQGSEEEILIGPFGLGSSTPIQCRTPASNERRERQSILIH